MQWWYKREALCRPQAPNAASAATPDFPVGTEVQLARGYEEYGTGGNLVPGQKGVIVTSDGTGMPYQVSLGGHWFTRGELCKWGAANAAPASGASAASATDDFPVGTEVQLAEGHEAALGILKAGDKAMITESDGSDMPYEVTFEGRTDWYSRGVLCKWGAANAAPASGTGAASATGAFLPVGTEVQLAEGFEAEGGRGILQPGQKGVVVENDGSSVPYKVSFGGDTHWYFSKALCRWGAPSAAKPSAFAELAAAGSEGHPALYVGDTVKRGADWDWGEQDGGAGKLGTVTGPCDDWVKVTWAANNDSSHIYRYGEDSHYDLKLVAAKFTHPEHPHVLTWSTSDAEWICDQW